MNGKLPCRRGSSNSMGCILDVRLGLEQFRAGAHNPVPPVDGFLE